MSFSEKFYALVLNTKQFVRISIQCLQKLKCKKWGCFNEGFQVFRIKIFCYVDYILSTVFFRNFGLDLYVSKAGVSNVLLIKILHLQYSYSVANM